MHRVKFGIVGAGFWANAHADVYKSYPNVEIMAVCDADYNKAKLFADKYGIPKVFQNYSDMVKSDDIDAVAIVTPDYLHTGPVVAAAEENKHIIVEKPLATTLEDLNAIAKIVKDKKIKLMVDFHNRWNPPIAITKKSIDSGELGNIISAYFILNDIIDVPLKMISWAEKSSILWFLGSHTIDTLRYLFNDEVKSVYALSRSGILKGKGINVSDIYQVLLEFNSGIIATIENGWITPNSQPFINDYKLNILGSKGMINVDLSNNTLIEKFTGNKYDHPDCLIKTSVYDRQTGFAYESIKDFVDCLLNDKDVKVGLEDGINTSRVILAIMESSEIKKPVDVKYVD